MRLRRLSALAALILMGLQVHPALAAMQTLGPIYYPNWPTALGGSPGYTNTITLDAAGEKHACIFPAPATGTITGGYFTVGTVTTGDTVDVRLETVDGTTGHPTGTLQGVTTNGSATLTATTDNNKAIAFTFTAGASVTKGDIVALVVVNGSGPGNFTVSRYADDASNGMPYTDAFTGGAWATSGTSCVAAISYGGTYYPMVGVFPFGLTTGATSLSTQSYSSSSSPDEYALRCLNAVKSRTSGVWVWNSATTGAYELNLYAPDNTVVAGPITVDPDIKQGTSANRVFYPWPTSATLTANTYYKLAQKPTTTTAVALAYFYVPTAAAMGQMDGGTACYLGTRTDAAGAGGDENGWTWDTTRRPIMGLALDQFDDGSGGAGTAGGLVGGGLVR